MITIILDNNHLQRESSCQIIESLQQSEFEEIKFDVSESCLCRNDIYNKMINLDKKRQTLPKIKIFKFDLLDKMQKDMGVTLDAYSIFSAELCNKFDGERDKIPSVMNFPEEDLHTNGNIIHHVLYN